MPTDPEIKRKREQRFISYKPLLHALCTHYRPTHILEWGTGKSTRMMSAWLPDAAILTLEYDAKWARKQEAALVNYPNVTLAYRAIHPKLKAGASNGYVTYPMQLSLTGRGPDKYDLIFVDGRFRQDCLTMAFLLAHTDTPVVLHDAKRKNYLPGVFLFPHHHYFEAQNTYVMGKSPDILKVLENHR